MWQTFWSATLTWCIFASEYRQMTIYEIWEVCQITTYTLPLTPIMSDFTTKSALVVKIVCLRSLILKDIVADYSWQHCKLVLNVFWCILWRYVYCSVAFNGNPTHCYIFFPFGLFYFRFLTSVFFPNNFEKGFIGKWMRKRLGFFFVHSRIMDGKVGSRLRLN